ncbi:hypothetical protein [Candidatus Nitrospira allomarina]|jgi:hypothetical protein|uniref:Uncharacterized protein n=1 Tax=Candidatus Nitrospira allomarina TaxID=3020900 RepID=A0AA96K025_9BACT|nr:hypothetical protein [Candidatus Nitrospira allomarina]WNM59264.1 hypothetical protein PP769_05725 [Candidatus Nitrospira allomarina]
MEEGAWYKVGGFQIVQKDEATFFNLAQAESGEWEHPVCRNIVQHGSRVPSIWLIPIGWRQYKPTRFFEHLIRKTFGWLFLYFIGL